MKKIKKNFVNDKNISFTVKGNNWGMGSNSIHMVDIFCFITGDNKIIVSKNELETNIYNSKRKGFFEFKGRLTFKNSKGDSLVLIDNKHQEETLSKCIESDSQLVLIDQVRKTIIWKDYELNTSSKSILEVPLQSNLTHKIVAKILKTKQSKLTSLEESYNYHGILLELFSSHLSKIHKQEYKYCPIT